MNIYLIDLTCKYVQKRNIVYFFRLFNDKISHFKVVLCLQIIQWLQRWTCLGLSVALQSDKGRHLSDLCQGRIFIIRIQNQHWSLFLGSKGWSRIFKIGFRSQTLKIYYIQVTILYLGCLVIMYFLEQILHIQTQWIVRSW